MRDKLRVPAKATAAVMTAAVLLGACAQQGQGPGTKETVGGVLGAVGGAVAGAQFGGGKGQLAATAIGTLAGAYIGSRIGASMDEVDKMKSQRTTQQALETNPTGTTSTWRNPDTGNYGTVTPVDTYQRQSTVCREYTTTVYIGGEQETARGTACRQPDGTWKIVE